MAGQRCFISFDYDHDDNLRTMLLGQSRNDDSPFEITDWSVKEELSGDWKAKVRTRIRKVSQVIVICGYHTHSATGVSTEIRIARDEKKLYFLLAGRASGTNRKPTAALSTDTMYNWTWKNLKTLIGGGR